MRVKFTLSMPSNNSWDGKWSGASRNYFKVLEVSEKKAADIISKGRFTYNFGDGWIACIKAERANGRQPKSDGFCGYDWMIDSIRAYGDIRIERKKVSGDE
jgi:hypothetical protein